jgi:hypothetical protein
MQVLVVMLIGAFVIGGTRLGDWLRRHPPALITLSAIAAASYYALRVVE